MTKRNMCHARFSLQTVNVHGERNSAWKQSGFVLMKQLKLCAWRYQYHSLSLPLFPDIHTDTSVTIFAQLISGYLRPVSGTG